MAASTSSCSSSNRSSSSNSNNNTKRSNIILVGSITLGSVYIFTVYMLRSSVENETHASQFSIRLLAFASSHPPNQFKWWIYYFYVCAIYSSYNKIHLANRSHAKHSLRYYSVVMCYTILLYTMLLLLLPARCLLPHIQSNRSLSTLSSSSSLLSSCIVPTSIKSIASNRLITATLSTDSRLLMPDKCGPITGNM